jgi:hypothetical protein
LVPSVIAGVAESDPNRALDLALGLTSPMERMQSVQFAAMTNARDDASAAAMANRLLASDDPAIRDNVASMVVMMWAQRAPDRAMSWLLAHSQAAPQSAFQQVGQQLAMRNPESAIAYTAQVPESAREQWAHGVALGYAQNDAPGAIDWLGRFRSEPWYKRAAGMIAMTVAQTDGAAAARLYDEVGLDDTSGMRTPQLVTQIAASWANQDPAAAADWAITRATGQQRDMALRNVIGVWSAQDLNAARQWTLRLPQGAARDAVLPSVLMASAMQPGNNIDGTLLNAFASPQSRQSAVLQIVQGFAYSDPAKARMIGDTHLDPALRPQVERMIEAARNQSPYPINIGVTQGVAPARAVPVGPPRAR